MPQSDDNVQCVPVLAPRALHDDNASLVAPRRELVGGTRVARRHRAGERYRQLRLLHLEREVLLRIC